MKTSIGLGVLTRCLFLIFYLVMRLPLLFFLVLFLGCQVTDPQITTGDSTLSPETPSSSQQEVLLENATGAPLVFALFAPGSARPLRQFIQVDLSSPPPTYVLPGNTAPLFPCSEVSNQVGATIHLYQISAVSDEEATAELASSVRLDAPRLSELSPPACIITIDKL